MSLHHTTLSDTTKRHIHHRETAARTEYLDAVEELVSQLPGATVIDLRWINANDDTENTVYHVLTVVTDDAETTDTVRHLMDDTLLEELTEQTHAATNGGHWLHFN